MKTLLAIIAAIAMFPMQGTSAERIKDVIISGTFDMSASTSKTGSGNVVLANAPTVVNGVFTAPSLGVATATSLTTGTVTINISPMSANFGQAYLPSDPGGVSGKELLLSIPLSNGTGCNVLALENKAQDGYSALACRDYLGGEKFAIGWGNPLEVAGVFQSVNYIQSWASGTTPPDFYVNMDGVYGGIGSGFRFYRRMGFRWNASFASAETNFYHLIPWGTQQKAAFQIAIQSATAPVAMMKVVAGDVDCSFQFWKDQGAGIGGTPTRAFAIGLGVGSIASDLIVNAFSNAGGGWREVMRMNNAGTILSFGGVGAGNPAFKFSGTTIKARLGDDSGDAPVTAGTLTSAKLIGSSSAPGIATGAGAGTGASVAITGNDMAGEITINAGTLPSVASVAATITFTSAYGTAPYVVMWPSNTTASALTFLPYVNATTTAFTVNTAAAISFGGSTTYKYMYHVIQ